MHHPYTVAMTILTCVKHIQEALSVTHNRGHSNVSDKGITRQTSSTNLAIQGQNHFMVGSAYRGIQAVLWRLNILLEKQNSTHQLSYLGNLMQRPSSKSC